MNPTPNNRHRPRVLFVFVQHFFPVAGVVLPLFGRRIETSDWREREQIAQSHSRVIAKWSAGWQHFCCTLTELAPFLPAAAELPTHPEAVSGITVKWRLDGRGQKGARLPLWCSMHLGCFRLVTGPLYLDCSLMLLLLVWAPPLQSIW